MSKQNTITQRQRALYWRAHHAACVNLGLSTPEEREEYRRRVMREEAGCEHLAEVGRTDGFDRVVKRFAADAGDYETACRFAVGDEARKAALIRICCAQVLQLKGCRAGSEEAADYLAGIVEQARIPCGRELVDSSFWLDCSPDSLLALFQMLDTHRRRLLRAALDGRTARTFLGFDSSVRYEPLPGGGVRFVYDARAYDGISEAVRVNVVKPQREVAR